MSHPFNDDDPESSGYSEADEAAIIATLEAVGLKPGVNIQKILFLIVQMVDAVSGGGAHPHHVLYESDIHHPLKTLLTKLEAVVKEHDELTDILRAHVKAQRARLCTELAMLDGLTMTPFDPIRVEHELRSSLKYWPSLAQAHPVKTRQILRKLLPNRIRVWREVRGGEKCYRFEGEAAVGNFFNGLASIERSGVPPYYQLEPSTQMAWGD